MDFSPLLFLLGIIGKYNSRIHDFENFAGYSGSHAAVVGSVLVTNLMTGKRYGGWDSAEVQTAAA